MATTMKLNALRDLFDAVERIIDLFRAIPEANRGASKSDAALSIAPILTLLESELPEARANALTVAAKARQEGGKLADDWQLYAALKSIRKAWIVDDFDTMRDTARKCWWAILYAEKLIVAAEADLKMAE